MNGAIDPQRCYASSVSTRTGDVVHQLVTGRLPTAGVVEHRASYIIIVHGKATQQGNVSTCARALLRCCCESK